MNHPVHTPRMLLAAVLAAVFFWMLLPAAAEEADTAGAVRVGDILCFGAPDADCGFDGRWQVLDSAHTNTGDGNFSVPTAPG